MTKSPFFYPLAFRSNSTSFKYKFKVYQTVFEGQLVCSILIFSTNPQNTKPKIAFPSNNQNKFFWSNVHSPIISWLRHLTPIITEWPMPLEPVLFFFFFLFSHMTFTNSIKKRAAIHTDGVLSRFLSNVIATFKNVIVLVLAHCCSVWIFCVIRIAFRNSEISSIICL